MDTPKRQSLGARREQWLTLALVWVFFTVAVWHLDRLPAVFEDEPWILAPGYKLFTQGVFGSDLFTGFHNMEQHYLQFMPLFSVLQGAFTQISGIGLFQLRFVPVVCATLLVALSSSIARKLGPPRAGAVAVLLLLTWQWLPEGSHRHLPSGVPLVDIARMARYDTLAALLGVCAWACFIRARKMGAAWFDLWCGLFIGAAGLSHVVGFFWLPVFVVTVVLTSPKSFSRWVRASLRMTAGAVLITLPWVMVLGANWGDAVAQARVQPFYFNLTQLSFYLNNLMGERSRYFLGLNVLAGAWRPTLFVMLIGLPLAWLFVFRRAARQRNPQAVWLAVPSVMMPALFALMLYSKSSFYLPTLVAMFGVLLAVALAHGLRSTFAVRLAICASIVVVTGFGGMGLTQMHLRASQIASPQAYLAALRQAVPAQARVLGMPNHWLGLLANPYRAIHLTFYLTSPYIEPHPVSLATALQHIAPEIVLMDTFLDELYSDRSTPQTSQRSDVFWQFMRDHHARLTATIQDNAGNPIRVYQLTY